jgi:tetratricopeptide (TPR) repeat protein
VELDDDLYEQVARLSEEGNDFMDATQYPKAVAVFQQALDLLPLPRIDWDAYTWLNAALGDAYFLSKSFAEAKAYFLDALNGPEGLNPFVFMRLGQCQLELGELASSSDSLARAYMLAGEDVFKEEDLKYLASLKQSGFKL